MQVDNNRALEYYLRLDVEQQAPTLHPFYVCADAKRDKSFEPVFFIFEENDNIYYHGFHLGNIPNTEYFDIQSPYGYGGPLASCDDSGFLSRAWSQFSLWCAENNVIAEFIRFHPLLQNHRYFIGDVIDDRPTIWIDLTVDDLMSSYTTRVRTAIRKAEKNGLKIEWVKGADYVSVFCKMYNSAMQEIGADEFYTFPLEYHEALLSAELSHLAVCTYEGTILAAALFLLGPRIGAYHLSFSTLQGKKMGATNLLLHEAALYSKERGCTLLHMGGGTDSKLDNPLLFFKGTSNNWFYAKQREEKTIPYIY